MKIDIQEYFENCTPMGADKIDKISIFSAFKEN
jgi:hypothetical protein